MCMKFVFKIAVVCGLCEQVLVLTKLDDILVPLAPNEAPGPMNV